MSNLSALIVALLAVSAQAVVAGALTPFVGWYVTTGRTSAVVVMDSIRGRFVDFVD